jgi:flagellar basal-body rod protein FlgF
MSYGLYAAVCGNRCQERRLEILSNNLANVNNAGFKEDRVIFDGFTPSMSYPIMLADTASQSGYMLAQKMSMSYPTFSGVRTDFSPGEMKVTGNELDFAIRGKGLFVVTTPKGELYTRMGNFSLNDKEELVTNEGYPVKGKGGSIKIKGTEISSNIEGVITVDGVEADTLKVVDFKDYSGLRKVGDNLFENVGGKGNEQEAKECEIDYQCLEFSNINIVKEMVKMIDVHRICESYQKVIQSLDEMDSMATREVGVMA